MSPDAVRLTRRVGFSSGHRYWIDSRSEVENRALFGEWASRFNHGHNYALELTVEGAVDPATGMVVNIKRIDDILQSEVVARFDRKSLNDEVEPFGSVVPTLENLLLAIRGFLSGPFGALIQMPSVRVVRLKLEESPTLYAELHPAKGENASMTITRVYEFAASHRLYSAELGEAKNIELYGKCTNPAGHGHNFLLEVTVSGDTEPATGMSVDIGKLDSEVERLVVDRYDHRNLNVDLPEFQGRVPTSEVVVAEIWRSLDGNVPGTLQRVRLHETARNIFEVARA